MKPNSPLFALIPFVSLAVASPLTWGSTQIPLGGVSNGQFGTDFKVPTAPPNSGCHMSKAAQLAAQLATDSMDAVIETHFELGKEEFEQNRQGLYKDMHLNLDELRLIQLEGQEPIWVSEWDKIKMKAKGINFFDMYVLFRLLGCIAKHFRLKHGHSILPSRIPTTANPCADDTEQEDQQEGQECHRGTRQGQPASQP